MALRNQPYIPLYVNDFISDEKLIECSAESTGVYIRLMCLMHKSEDYGQLKLNDKYQDKDMVKNYAEMLEKQMPYSYEIIYRSLLELLKENVLFFMKNTLTQKRMFNDGVLSQNRAKAGSMGGKQSKQNSSKVSSKTQANYEYEIEYINDNDNIYNYYSNNINNSISGIEYEKLNNWLKIFSTDIIKYGIDICVMNKARNMNYLNAVLNNWNKSGYKSLEEIKQDTKKSKEDKPMDNLYDYDWLNEEKESK